MTDKRTFLSKRPGRHRRDRCAVLIALIGNTLGGAIAEPAAIFLSPTLGRPEVTAPGERIAVRLAGVEGQAVSQARLLAPSTPRFAQRLILPAGEQTLVDPIQPLQIVAPRGTPAQVYDLELTIAGQTIRARHAVVVRPVERQPIRIAHLVEIRADATGALSLTPEHVQELLRWQVDFIAISAVRLDERPKAWAQLLSTLATSTAPVLLAPGAGVDLGAFGTHISPNLNSRLDLGAWRAVTAISTPQRTAISDPEQQAWIADWLKAAPPRAHSVIVMDHGVAPASFGQTVAPLVLAANDRPQDAGYAIVELPSSGTSLERPRIESYSFDTLVSEVAPADDLAPHAVQLVLRNRSPRAITNASQRVVLSGGAQPWCLGGKLMQVVQVDERVIVDWVGDVPARGVISVIIGTGDKPTLPSIAAAFDTPQQLTPQRAARGPWGTIALRNTSTTAARVRPLIMLNERYVPYQIRGLAQQGGNFRFELAAGERIELELLTPREQLTTGQHDLQLYLTQLPVWQTLNHPITLAAD